MLINYYNIKDPDIIFLKEYAKKGSSVVPKKESKRFSRCPQIVSNKSLVGSLCDNIDQYNMADPLVVINKKCSSPKDIIQDEILLVLGKTAKFCSRGIERNVKIKTYNTAINKSSLINTSNKIDEESFIDDTKINGELSTQQFNFIIDPSILSRIFKRLERKGIINKRPTSAKMNKIKRLSKHKQTITHLRNHRKLYKSHNIKKNKVWHPHKPTNKPSTKFNTVKFLCKGITIT